METKIVNCKMVITGESYFSFLNKPNTKGNYPSNCYEVSIANPTFSFPKSYNENLIAEIFNEVLDDMIKESADENKVIRIRNSKYPIPTYNSDGKTIIENPKLPNGTKILVKCFIKYNEKFNKYFLVVQAVKTIDKFEETKPFDDMDDFDIDF